MTSTEKKPNKFAESLKKGFADIQLVLEEGNYKLFLKQLVLIILLILGYRHFNTALLERADNLRGQMDAVNAQYNNEAEYLSNKEKLLSLEPRFPDVSAKNDWLLRQIISVFRDSELTPKFGSAQAEDNSNSTYTAAVIPVSLESSFGDFGRLLANFENSDEFLKVVEFDLTKNTEKLGMNSISMRVSTIFPKEKIGQTLFKDAKTGGAKK